MSSEVVLYVLVAHSIFPIRLPLGAAGVLAGCFGVAGAVVGMSEVWYTGPLGKMAGAVFGADLGFEVSADAPLGGSSAECVFFG